MQGITLTQDKGRENGYCKDKTVPFSPDSSCPYERDV